MQTNNSTYRIDWSKYSQLVRGNEIRIFAPQEWASFTILEPQLETQAPGALKHESKITKLIPPVASPAPITIPPVPLKPIVPPAAAPPPPQGEPSEPQDKTSPLCIGVLERARWIFLFETDLEARDFAKAMNIPQTNGCAVLSTRGPDNAWLSAGGVLPPECQLYLWPQRKHQAAKSPLWLPEAIKANSQHPIRIAWIPNSHPERDFNFSDWRRELEDAGVSLEQIRTQVRGILNAAQLEEGPPSTEPARESDIPQQTEADDGEIGKAASHRADGIRPEALPLEQDHPADGLSKETSQPVRESESRQLDSFAPQDKHDARWIDAPPQTQSPPAPDFKELTPSSFPPPDARPCYRLYFTAFTVGDRFFCPGVYYHFLKTEKDADGNKIEVAVDRWILSILWVLCIVRTDSGNGHAYLIEYIPHGETTPRRAVISQAGLLGRGEEALKELRDLGISVLGCNAKYVREYLDSEHLRFSSQKTPNDFWTSRGVIGWSPAGQCFLLPNQIIGKQTGVWFSGNNTVVQYKKSGSLEQWKNNVAAPCEGNSYLIVALCCGLTGPLLELLNIPGLGLHYYGDSTTGKSTSLVVAAASWGSEKFRLSWRATINGLESQAISRSSTLIPVDESHEVDPKVLDASVYMLLNGTAKARMNKDTSAREIEHWWGCVFSTGERSIEIHQASAKIDHKVGQTVRIIDVPVVTGPHGLFTDIHDSKNGAGFSDALRDAAAKNCGHAGPLFIQKLIDNYSGLRLAARLAGLQKKFGDNLSAQDARVARSFAAIALAGELAIEWGILPWQPHDTLFAAVELFDCWKRTQSQSTKSKEHEQILRCLSDFIDAHGNSRFLDINWSPRVNPKTGLEIAKDPLVRDQVGYFDDSSGERIYLFTAGGLREAIKGFDFKRVLQALEEASAFVKTAATQKSVPTRVPEGAVKHLYHIDPAKLIY